MSDFQSRIRTWAQTRGLTEHSTPHEQVAGKLLEEIDELHDAIVRGERMEITDAIGDIQVVLAVICAQLDLDIDTCREAAWHEIKGRTGRVENGVFVKDE